MAKIVRQTTFNSGEVDINVWKRTDSEMYLTACQSLLNMEVGTTLLAQKAKGTQFLLNVTAYADPKSNIYEFIDQNNNYYVIMTSNQKIEVFKTNPFSHYQTISSTPYLSADLDFIDYAEDNDNLIFTNSKYPPARVYISDYSDPVNPVFAYQVLNISPYPSYDFATINYNGYSVSYSISGSTLTYNITNGAGATGFTTAWIGGQIVGQGNSDTQPIAYANITNVSNSGNTTTFTATIIIPFLPSGFSTSGSQYSIRQPAWSSVFGWPAKVVFYQNRLWLANTTKQPNTLFGSQINSPIDFDVGSGADTDAIVYAIAGNTGAILWLNGGKQLEIYTVKNEFACPQDQNSALTPGTFAVRQQASYGASPSVKPTTYINDSYYLAKTGKAIINFHFEGVGLTYSSSNVSPQSSHLVNSPISRGLIQGDDDSQDNFIYYLNPDNSLTSFQFSSEAKLAALTPRSFNTNPDNPVNILDIETVNNQLYLLKFLPLSNQYIMDVMSDDYRQDSAQAQNMASSGVITGLDDFEGYTVDVLFEGQDFGEYEVIGGTITADNPLMLSGSATIGMIYDVNLSPMYIYAGQTEADYLKIITSIYVDYENAIDFYINGTLVPYQFYANIQAQEPIMPVTDTAVIYPTHGYNRFDTFNITQHAPFDLKILGITYKVEANLV